MNVNYSRDKELSKEPKLGEGNVIIDAHRLQLNMEMIDEVDDEPKRKSSDSDLEETEITGVVCKENSTEN
jgi:hypothetical protein